MSFIQSLAGHIFSEVSPDPTFCFPNPLNHAFGRFSNSLLIRSEVNSDMKPSDFNIIGLECDVSSELSVQKAFQATLDKFGRVDSVIASAGMPRHQWEAAIA
jgi:NAD(P)-dependent dehydrogenase (short-subunit alcohol dehydrogenase family)